MSTEWSVNTPSELSVCGVWPSDRLKVPLSVQVTSETSVSETDISLQAVESSWGGEGRQMLSPPSTLTRNTTARKVL